MNWLAMDTWSPYAVGIGIGVLSWITFVLSDKPLGCSTAYVRFSGMIEKYLRGKDAVEAKEYYREFPPVIDWQAMLVIGIVLGALTSAIFSGSFDFHIQPALWADHFGNTPVRRVLMSFLGGILIGLGARWGNGCTSGHGISGTLQLALSSWAAVLCFFVSGILTAFIIY